MTWGPGMMIATPYRTRDGHRVCLQCGRTGDGRETWEPVWATEHGSVSILPRQHYGSLPEARRAVEAVYGKALR